MTEYKKQHYVPRSYLRHFSQDGVGVCRYSLAKETSERSNIDKTCASFYFYAKGKTRLEFEKAMSQLETKHAEIIQKILDMRNVAFILPKDAEDYFQNLWYLHNFILLTATRTKLAKEETEEALNAVIDIMKPAFVQSEEAKAKGITREALNNVKLRRDTAGLEGMMHAIKGAAAISDLALTLLINETAKPFITSDSPTVLYNFLKLGDLSTVGWQAPGLMIFLPIDEEITLWLFDSAMYELNSNVVKAGAVVLRKDQDVDELNRLQALNAGDYLIFSNASDRLYVSSLHKPLKRRRRSKLISPEKVDFGDGRDMHRLGRTQIAYPLHLSFFRVDKSYVQDRKSAYKKHVTKFGPYRPFVRNEALYAFCRRDEQI
jgi:hypothetical protein